MGRGRAAAARDENHAPDVVLHRRGGGWGRPQLPADPLEALHRCGPGRGSTVHSDLSEQTFTVKLIAARDYEYS